MLFFVELFIVEMGRLLEGCLIILNNESRLWNEAGG